MIELAAHAWKVDLPAAMRRLARSNVGLPPETVDLDRVRTYIREYPQQRQALSDVLAAGGRQIISGDYDALRRSLGLLNGSDGKIWIARMGKFVAGTSAAAVDAAIRPYAKVTWHGKRELFPAGKWRDIIAIPFHDLPERCAGLFVVGRRGRRPEDECFVPAVSLSRSPTPLPIEIGVCMYDAILATSDNGRFGPDVFVVEDPVLAVQLQALHMRDHSVPLPLVGTYPQTTQFQQKTVRLTSYRVWETQPQRRFIFWGEALTPSLVNMAARACGYIAVHPRLPRRAPQEWLRRLRQVARPWLTVLDEFLERATVAQADAMLDQLDLPDHLWAEFRRRCSETARARILASEGHAAGSRVAMIGSRTVLESPSGWVYNGNTICDATLTITHVLYQAETDRTYYKGRINYHGHEYPFLERQEIVETGTFSWMRKRLVAEQAGMMVYESAWSKHAINIACLMHTPIILQGVGRFGWRYDHSAFVLPRFSIHPGGECVECDAQILDDLAPGTEILPNRLALAITELEELTTDTPIQRVFWASAAAVAANIIAPAVNRKPAGVGLVGDGAVVMGRTAARLWGCVDRALALNKQSLLVCQELEEMVEAHAWPLIITAPTGDRRQLLAPWLQSPSHKNVVLDVDRYFADALRTQANWRFITSDEPITSAPAVETYGQSALFQWLMDLCRRRLRVDGNRAAPASVQVLEDMAAWAKREGGNEDVVLAGADLLDELSDSVDRANSFIALLYRCIDEGVLEFLRAGFESQTSASAIYFLEEGEHPAGIFIPRAAVNRVFAEHGVPVPDIVQLTATLAEAGGLECETQYQDMTGWLIRETWWNQQIELCRTQRSRILRIAN